MCSRNIEFVALKQHFSVFIATPKTEKQCLGYKMQYRF